MDTTFGGIGIKGLKSHMGHDSLCFRATLTFQGKPVGDASNDGNGSCNLYHFKDGASHRSETFTAMEEAAEAWLAANDGWWTEFIKDGRYGPEALDAVIGEIIAYTDCMKKTKALLKRALVIRLPDGTMYQWPKKQDEDRIRAHVADRYPDATILNDVPVEEAQPHLFT